MIGHNLAAYLEDDCRLFQRALAGEDVVAPSVMAHHALHA